MNGRDRRMRKEGRGRDARSGQCKERVEEKEGETIVIFITCYRLALYLGIWLVFATGATFGE